MKTRKPNPGSKAGPEERPVDVSAKFEELLKSIPPVEHYSLRLYITGTTARSTLAISNIRNLCDEFLSGHYDLEVIDIYQQPLKAMEGQIIAAPTLVKEFPTPPKRLVGDLSNRDKVIIGLNLRGQLESSETIWAKV